MTHPNDPPAPSNTPLHAATLRAFVLDQLEPTAREAVEARLLADEDAFAHAREVEDDLLDAYVRGELDAVTRARVDETLLATADDRARLVVARGLHQRHRRHQRPPRAQPAATWRWAIAALLLVAIGAGWWSTRLGPDPAVPAGTQVVALALGMGTRGTQTPSLTVPADAAHVRLDLDLEGTPPLPRYRVTVQGSTDDLIWSNDRMAAQATPWGRQLVVVIPAEALPSGNYTVTIVAADSDESTAPIGHFPFRINPATP